MSNLEVEVKWYLLSEYGVKVRSKADR